MLLPEPGEEQSPHISVQIDRLVLEGVSVSRNNHQALQAAVETELSRLLTGQGLAPRLPGRRRSGQRAWAAYSTGRRAFAVGAWKANRPGSVWRNRE